MKAAEIRQRFLEFFGSRGHEVAPSAVLIPHNDPTLFFVNAGMVPFKETFLGKEQREIPRATSVQKCLRVSGKHNDLENVGRTPRHHTLFEMLGNFSFGDYFKRDAIPMAWELLTGELGVDPDRLWITVFEDDDEAHSIWRDRVGIPEARIQRMGASENFWSMGDTGPCGPCSEIHYDHGPAISSDTRGPIGGGDRYVEIWNLVFMQYDQHADGTRVPLPRPSIDTGMGLERIAAVLQGVYSNYDTDLFQPLITRASEIADLSYGTSDDGDTALRVIADHSRATAFLIADGVLPSNEGRGYVLRRIMRRAIRFGVKLGIERPFFHEITRRVIRDFHGTYPELAEHESFVDEVVQGEEDRFRRTLDRGMRLLESELSRCGDDKTLSGEVAFTLSDTYGFPVDLTDLIAREQDFRVDREGFEAALDAQRARGRAAWKGSGEESVSALWYAIAEHTGPTRFAGYDHTESTGTVLAMIRRGGSSEAPELEECEALSEGDTGILILDKTPFYAESGGQVGDTGEIAFDEGSFAVRDTTRVEGLHLHHGTLLSGSVRVGDPIVTRVASEHRDDTRRNHTATHLLHAALRTVLGEHVTQKGSLVAPRRLRFDFAHHKPVSHTELSEIEQLVNTEILRNTDVVTHIQDLEEAKAAGAMALFGEKYADRVRVVDIPGFSIELCGGTHVSRTGDIGLFRITSESGIAAGVRRIEAQTGLGALAQVQTQSARLDTLSSHLKVPADQLLDAVQRLQDDRRRLEKELDTQRQELAKHAARDLIDGARTIHGVKVIATTFDGDLRKQADRLRDQLGSSLIVLARISGEKVTLLAATTKDLAGARVHAGKVIQELAPLIGGRGGGRPDLAQAGGRDPAGVPAALERAYVYATELLGD